MNIDSQRLGYKLQRVDLNYSRKLQKNLADSHQSFSQIETPGWSSMIKSQLSDRQKLQNHPQKYSNHQNYHRDTILKKLNQNNPLNWNRDHEKKMIKQKKEDNISRSQIKLNHKNQSPSKIKASQPKQKRFHHITVHQHLYLDGNKQRNKRLLQKIVDSQTKKQQIFSFKPMINKKSNQLAQLKFSRAKQRQGVEKQLGIDSNKQQLKQQETKPSEQVEKQCKQIERHRILNKSFYYLSDGELILSEETLNSTLADLPLFCIKVIQPILQQVYRGRTMQWMSFLELFNSSNIKNKESFLTVMGNWLQRKQKNKGD